MTTKFPNFRFHRFYMGGYQQVTVWIDPSGSVFRDLITIERGVMVSRVTDRITESELSQLLKELEVNCNEYLHPGRLA